MITLKEIYEINKNLVETFGGAGIGFSDRNLAESCVSSLDQEVFDLKLYPKVEDKISYLVFSIIANHIFIDGNKRTGIQVLLGLSLSNNLGLVYNKDELINLALGIAESKLDKTDVRDWIINHESKRNLSPINNF